MIAGFKNSNHTGCRMANQYNREWSDEELAAAVDAYLEMLRHQKDGRPYNKAEINRSLREPGSPLQGRTKASIEYRMQNISAVLADEKLPIVEGYAPAANVGENIRTRILSLLKKRLS